MKMDRDAIRARQLRLAMIKQLFLNHTLSESEAKQFLCAPLEPGNASTFVDDSYLLHDANAFEVIESQLETD